MSNHSKVDERSRKVARRFELPLVVAALLVIPVLAVEQARPGQPWEALTGVLNWAIWLVFATEMVVMLAIVPSRAHWLREHPLEVAIVVLTPPFLPAGLEALRVFRLLRLLPLLLSAGRIRRLFSLDGLRYAGVLGAVSIIGGGAAFAAVERTPERPLSTWDGIWWAVTTATTVGYGDIFPMTDEGRAVAVGVMLVGIGFIALVTGAVAQRFIAPPIEQEVAEVVSEERVLGELKDISARLDRLEQALREPTLASDRLPSAPRDPPRCPAPAVARRRPRWEPR